MTSNLRSLRRFVDVTSQKSNKIEYLQRQVNDAGVVVAAAQAKYDSFVIKANIFSGLYTEALADQQTAEGYWKLFLQVKSDLDALRQTTDEANLIAVDAFYDVQQLIVEWESVTAATIKAAEAILLSADYIQKRKASNNLISDDLVQDATAAASAAETTVKIVITALTDALSTLSSSAQANNSTEMTDVYVGLAVVAILENDIDLSLLRPILMDPSLDFGKREIAKIMRSANSREPLETSLSKGLDKAKSKTTLSLAASESANREMNKAKEELSEAEAALETWQAALVAAETAVAG